MEKSGRCSCACGGMMHSLGIHKIAMDIDTFVDRDAMPRIYSKDLPVEVFQCDRCGEIRLFRSHDAEHTLKKSYEDAFRDYSLQQLRKAAVDPAQPPLARRVAQELLKERRDGKRAQKKEDTRH